MGIVPESGNAAFGTSYDLSRSAKGIDVIIDGHSHTPLDEIQQQDAAIPIASAGSGAEALGVVEFFEENGKLVPQLRTMTRADLSGSSPDAQVTAVIERWLEAQQAAGSEVVAYNSLALDYDEDTTRTEETALGNLIADALLEAGQADIALVNGGNICAPLPAGEVTNAQINEVLPYSNLIHCAQVSGAVVREVLEQSVSVYPQPQGGFMQVAGLKFSFDPEKPVGERVTQILVGGVKLDDNAAYRVVTNNFISSGGDDYTMLIEPFKSAVAVDVSDNAQLLIAYLARHDGELDPQIEGRITAAHSQNDNATLIIVCCVAGALILAAMMFVIIRNKKKDA
jgi:5'-nucleotidase